MSNGILSRRARLRVNAWILIHERLEQCGLGLDPGPEAPLSASSLGEFFRSVRTR